MYQKAQTSMEYLLIIIVAILSAAAVITLMQPATEQPGQTVNETVTYIFCHQYPCWGDAFCRTGHAGELCGPEATCRNGYCEPGWPRPAGCSDADGGRDFGTSSVCGDSGGLHSDSCSGTELTEWYCQGDTCLQTSKNCADNGKLCIAGACAPIDTTPPWACRDSTQCAAGWKCEAGKCVEIPSGTGCTTDDECGVGMKCESGTCIAVPPEPGCGEDNDCAVGWKCMGGECKRPEGGGCNSQEECSEGQICQNRICITPEVAPGEAIDTDCSVVEGPYPEYGFYTKGTTIGFDSEGNYIVHIDYCDGDELVEGFVNEEEGCTVETKKYDCFGLGCDLEAGICRTEVGSPISPPEQPPCTEQRKTCKHAP